MTAEELEKNGIATVTFNNLVIKPWGRANGQFVGYGISVTADSAVLVTKQPTDHPNNHTKDSRN